MYSLNLSLIRRLHQYLVELSIDGIGGKCYLDHFAQKTDSIHKLISVMRLYYYIVFYVLLKTVPVIVCSSHSKSPPKTPFYK